MEIACDAREAYEARGRLGGRWSVQIANSNKARVPGAVRARIAARSGECATTFYPSNTSTLGQTLKRARGMGNCDVRRGVSSATLAIVGCIMHDQRLRRPQSRMLGPVRIRTRCRLRNEQDTKRPAALRIKGREGMAASSPIAPPASVIARPVESIKPVGGDISDLVPFLCGESGPASKHGSEAKRFDGPCFGSHNLLLYQLGLTLERAGAGHWLWLDGGQARVRRGGHGRDVAAGRAVK